MRTTKTKSIKQASPAVKYKALYNKAVTKTAGISYKPAIFAVIVVTITLGAILGPLAATGNLSGSSSSDEPLNDVLYSSTGVSSSSTGAPSSSSSVASTSTPSSSAPVQPVTSSMVAFTPVIITTAPSPIMRFMASTLTQSNNAAVPSWRDSFTNVFATQSDASKQPVYRSTGLNSHPALYFDGSQSFIAPSTFPVGSVYTIVAVLINQCTDNCHILSSLTGSGSPTGSHAFMFEKTQSGIHPMIKHSSSAYNQAGLTPLNVAGVYTAVFEGATVKYYKNLETIGVDTQFPDGITVTDNSVCIGCTTDLTINFKGFLSVIEVYNEVFNLQPRVQQLITEFNIV